MYVKCEGNFMEVKCFVICTDLLLPLKVNFSYFEIQIFMFLKLESESRIQPWNPNPALKLRIPDPGFGLPSLVKSQVNCN